VARHGEREKDGLDKIIKTPTQSHSVSFFFFFSSGDDAGIPSGILSCKPEINTKEPLNLTIQKDFIIFNLH